MNTTEDPPQHDRLAVAMAIGSITLFSAKPIFIKWAFAYGIDAVSLMFLRLFLSAPLFIGIGLWAMRGRHVCLKDLSLACALGLLGTYTAGLLDMMGLQYIPAQLERMLLFTYPIFTVLLAWLWFKRPIKKAMLQCITLTYLGLSLMFMVDRQALGDDVILGTGLVLVSALTFAAYMVLSRGPIQRMGSMPFTAVAMLTATLVLSVHQWLLAPVALQSWAKIPAELWWIIMGLALICTVIPAFLGSEAVRRIGPEQVSMMGNVGPIVTTLLAVWLLNEAFTLYHAAGIALVIAGIWVLQRPAPTPQPIAVDS